MFGGALVILHVKCDRFHLEKSEKKKENVLALSADIFQYIISNLEMIMW
jgi:hypothetical protein